jgi:hypothetical protein
VSYGDCGSCHGRLAGSIVDVINIRTMVGQTDSDDLVVFIVVVTRITNLKYW